MSPWDRDRDRYRQGRDNGWKLLLWVVLGVACAVLALVLLGWFRYGV
jgi:hypothetical protein